MSMDAAIRRAAGRLPATPDPAATIPEDADPFTRDAMTLGVPADLVDAARAVIPGADELSGAALQSALTKAIDERPGLVTPGFSPPQGPEGLDGGAGRNAPRVDAAPSMDDLILIATCRKGSGYVATNGIYVQRGRED
jgi:hypothetical protein